MKLGVVGKGGVGKTTTSGLLCKAYAERGLRVLAVDTDSNPNLAISLGLTEDTADNAPILPRALVVGPGDGEMTASDLLGQYGLETPSGVRLLHAMRVSDAGAGCTCTSHATVRSLLGSAIEEEADVTLVDMEAGLEHLSRAGGTLAYADVLLAVMEPTHKSILTAVRTRDLAVELGIPKIGAVGNKARHPDDFTLFEALAGEHELPLAGIIPYDQAVPDSDRQGTPLEAESAPGVQAAIAGIMEWVESVYDEGASRRREKQSLLQEKQRINLRLLELRPE